jgi:hypothetical protein
MTELNDLNPSDAAVKAEANELTNEETTIVNEVVIENTFENSNSNEEIVSESEAIEAKMEAENMNELEMIEDIVSEELIEKPVLKETTIDETTLAVENIEVVIAQGASIEKPFDEEPLNESETHEGVKTELKETAVEAELNTETALSEVSNLINNEQNPESTSNLVTDAIEIAIDEHEFDADIAAIEHHELAEQNNYGSKTKDELLAIALLAMSEKPHTEALQIFKEIKPYFDAALNEEQNIALQKFIEEGGEKDDFEFKAGVNLRDTFNKAVKELRDRISAAKAIAEAERVKNLRAKENILEQIKALNSSEETKESLVKLKELQSEWKKIKNVPKEHVERLWESYRVLNEIFYDKLSIDNEIAQLDRERNLDAKIDLCKKVSELAEEKSIKSALIAVKKYQEDWRNIGPVPKEANEDIWNRFKAEVDKVYAGIKAETEKNEIVRQENLKLKLAIIEKAKELTDYTTTRIKDWMEKTKVANDLMEEWKKVGYVPMAEREKIWEEFKNSRNSFFNNKNNWFKTFNAVRNENLKKKYELIKEAENIAAAPIDWGKQTATIKNLQDQWKLIGPVPDKFNDEVWKKFRTACDLFFEKKAERFAEQNAEQGTNLIAKKELIVKLEALAGQETENVFDELKTIQSEWSKIGFVPNKDKDTITKSYNDLLDKIYGRYRELRKNMRQADDKVHFESMANNNDGGQRLQREERILQERIKGLKADIDTWDNNLGFFKNTNAKNEMVIQINDKIAAARRMIKELEEKVKTIRNLKNQSAKAE